jgi:hypothetical protein
LYEYEVLYELLYEYEVLNELLYEYEVLYELLYEYEVLYEVLQECIPRRHCLCDRYFSSSWGGFISVSHERPTELDEP